MQAFLAVAEHRSFSAAASALFITQPAVSKRIHSLENSLEECLFDRLAKQVSLTPAGQKLLPAARRVLSEVANCRAELQTIGGQIAGPLALGTSHHIGLRRLPTILREYIHTHPAVRVDLQLADSEDALERVLDNRLEIAVITLPSEPKNGLVVEALWLDPLVFCVATGHTLAALKSVTPPELVAHTALLPTRSSATRRLLEEQLQPHGQRLGQVLETNYLETNKGLAAAGLGWTLLPESMIEDDLEVLDLQGLSLHRKLGVVWREGKTLSAAANAFIDSLRANAACSS